MPHGLEEDTHLKEIFLLSCLLFGNLDIILSDTTGRNICLGLFKKFLTRASQDIVNSVWFCFIIFKLFFTDDLEINYSCWVIMYLSNDCMLLHMYPVIS